MAFYFIHEEENDQSRGTEYGSIDRLESRHIAEPIKSMVFGWSSQVVEIGDEKRLEFLKKPPPPLSPIDDVLILFILHF